MYLAERSTRQSIGNANLILTAYLLRDTTSSIDSSRRYDAVVPVTRSREPREQSSKKYDAFQRIQLG